MWLYCKANSFLKGKCVTSRHHYIYSILKSSRNNHNNQCHASEFSHVRLLDDYALLHTSYLVKQNLKSGKGTILSLLPNSSDLALSKLSRLVVVAILDKPLSQQSTYISEMDSEIKIMYFKTQIQNGCINDYFTNWMKCLWDIVQYRFYISDNARISLKEKKGRACVCKPFDIPCMVVLIYLNKSMSKAQCQNSQSLFRGIRLV